ncbi:1-acyl-sn-glycerol-3-phosphate acyltransferase [Sinorhizobium fredii]
MSMETGQPLAPASVEEQGSRTRDVIAIVADLARELYPQRARFINVRATSSIERDLGIDSLGRTELALRIERAFRVRLSAQTVAEAETVLDLAEALERAQPMAERVLPGARAAAILPAVPAATEARTLVEALEWHAARHPDRVHLTVLQDEVTSLSAQAWLWAIHNYRATFSASPNFGFEICLNKIADADVEGLDLSSLRMVANGAEPVSARTLWRFVERFGRYGFPATAMAPVYGLAECSVGLAFPPLGRPPLIDGVAEIATPQDAMALEIVACGQPLPGHEIRIVDDAGHECGDRREGRLEFRGPSTTAGYFRNDEKTRALFHDGWLDSGDRAYMAKGDVFVTGRVKDIIIRAGRHLYAHEIEQAVALVPGIRRGGVVAFGTSDRVSGTERIVVVAETLQTDPVSRASLQARIIEVTSDIAGTPADEVVLVPPRSVPKTSSGKIRRSAAKALYESGRMGSARPTVPLQYTRLMLLSASTQARRLARVFRETLYAAWWWTVLSVACLAGSLAVLIVPRLSWRWRVVRWIARAALAAMGVSVSTDGVERIPGRGAMLVFNHSSYVDALLLAAVLPGEPAIVAKRELAEQFIAGPLLRRLGIPFVERYDVTGSLQDAEALTELARKGRVLVFFPEGTFTRRAGLSGFYLGAFKVAAEDGLAILPGAIRGTRSMLRADQWFPRHLPLSIEIGEPIAPSGSGFESILRLRDAVRISMLARCGEPDLGELVKPEPPRSVAWEGHERRIHSTVSRSFRDSRQTTAAARV